jgi:FkbM family methyltransferase
MTSPSPAAPDRASFASALGRIREAAAEGKLLERAAHSLRGRATSLAWRAYLAARGHHTLTFEIGGTKVAIDSRSHLAFPLWAGHFERENLEYVLATARAGEVFVDVGANVGLYSVPVARRVGPAGRVLALEPCPPTAAKLRENIRRNGQENVEVIATAASDKAGKATFHVFPEGMDVYNSLGAARRPEGASTETIEVDTLPLDDLCAQRGVERVGILKVDVEGAEELVVRGARRLLADSPDLRVLLELYAPSAEQCGCRVETILATLSELGYTPHLASRGGGLQRIDEGELLARCRKWSVDPVFVRRGR